jgi:hypothetical protein
MSEKIMFQKTFAIRALMASLLFADIVILQFQFASISYDILSVTPLFFLHFTDYLFPLSILLTLLAILASFMVRDKVLFVFNSLVLYFIIFLAPYNIFQFPIYNDQLGFSVESLYGMRDGVVMPYQGEYSTLGHAFFTAITGKVLDLNLFQATRFVEIVFVFACFVAYLSLALSILKKYNRGSKGLYAVVIAMFFPAFALEPLVYSRGYFGLVVSIFLFLCMFKLMKISSAESFVLATITFVASSISYPLQPLIVIITMTLFILFSHLIVSSGGNKHEFRKAVPNALVFSVIWSAIQVYTGYASWGILHEIVWKALVQEFFTGLKQLPSRYVGEAAIYTNLRIFMIAAGWLMATFILLTFILNLLRNRNALSVELFASSLIASFCILGIIYSITFHEPALRFYRSLIATIPFALTCISDKFVGKSLPRKAIPTLLLIIITIFLILSPVIKWGWTFVGYPTEHDIALCNYVVSHGYTPNSVLYSPGSHVLFEFFTKLIPTHAWSSLRVYAADDIEFDTNKSIKARYTATFYRIYIYPRWYGKNINIIIDEIATFASQNNVLYRNRDLWLLIQKT